MIISYRKKPVVIQAVEWTGENCAEIERFCGPEILGALVFGHDFRLRTLEGEHIASVGDFIIRGIKGEHYPCKPDIFKATYEAEQ